MFANLKEGWELTRKQWFAILALFVCQWVWNLTFYKYLKSIVVDVMHRFPPQQMPGENTDLFLHESLVLLGRTRLAIPFIIAIAAFILSRMALVPLINAGLYYSLSEERIGRPSAFWRGVKRHGMSFIMLFWLRVGLIALPLIWVIPTFMRAFTQSANYGELTIHLMPVILGYIVYSSLIYLLFIYIQFGVIEQSGIWRSIRVWFRRVVPIVALAIFVFAVTSLTGTLFLSVAWVLAGYMALVLHLAYPLVQMTMRIWGIASLYRLFGHHV